MVDYRVAIAPSKTRGKAVLSYASITLKTYNFHVSLEGPSYLKSNCFNRSIGLFKSVPLDESLKLNTLTVFCGQKTANHHRGRMG